MNITLDLLREFKHRGITRTSILTNLFMQMYSREVLAITPANGRLLHRLIY